MKLFSHFINLFYPNHCLHCFDKIEKKYFCKSCIDLFSLISPEKGLAYFAVFEKRGPIISFLKEIKSNKIHGLIKLAASFIVLQHDNLNWEMPDVIAPAMENRFFKDHRFYLSKEAALLFGKPIKIKSSHDKTALFIDDVFNTVNLKKIQNENEYKKIYYLSLCASDIDGFHFFE